MKLAIVFLLGGLFWFSVPVSAQDKSNCRPIEPKIEIIKNQENSQSTLQIEFEDKGDYKIHVVDSKGNIQKTKLKKIEKLAPGEYDLVITDEGRADRCPFYKRIKVEAK
ncbi:MAG: hypothetical protein JNM57_11725 [Cyclobacteriaceae bacterium]|nr:hypothetical protein [Cyclobacteriaceae bacterium]